MTDAVILVERKKFNSKNISYLCVVHLMCAEICVLMRIKLNCGATVCTEQRMPPAFRQ